MKGFWMTLTAVIVSLADGSDAVDTWDTTTAIPYALLSHQCSHAHSYMSAAFNMTP